MIRFGTAELIDLFPGEPTRPSGDAPLPPEACVFDAPTVKVCRGCLRPVETCMCRPEAPAPEPEGAPK